MAQNPDPALSLTTIKGVTRTLDDWATVFSLAVVMLPARPEAAHWVPVVEQIFGTLGESDVRTVIWVAGNESITRRILGDSADRWLVFCDPDQDLARSLGLERLPAFVHLRQDTGLVTAAEGWDPVEWQRVADEIARRGHWTSPQIAGRPGPPPTPGWPVAV